MHLLHALKTILINSVFSSENGNKNICKANLGPWEVGNPEYSIPSTRFVLPI